MAIAYHVDDVPTSRKQTTVALSSGEAEMVAALSGACEGLGIHELWQRLVDFKSLEVDNKDQVDNKSLEVNNKNQVDNKSFKVDNQGQVFSNNKLNTAQRAPLQILCSDSTAAIGIVRRKGSSRRTRHVELKAFFLQQWAQRPLVQVVKVGTSDMLADALTKVMNMPTDHGTLLGLREQ